MNATSHILSSNLMLLYGSYMSGLRLKWRCLLFMFILFWFDLCSKEFGINQNIKKCTVMIYFGFILGFIVSKEGKNTLF